MQKTFGLKNSNLKATFFFAHNPVLPQPCSPAPSPRAASPSLLPPLLCHVRSLGPLWPDSVLWNHSGSSTMNTQFGSSAQAMPPPPRSAAINSHSAGGKAQTMAYEMNEERLRALLRKSFAFCLEWGVSWESYGWHQSCPNESCLFLKLPPMS